MQQNTNVLYNDAFDKELAIDKLRNETVLPSSFDFFVHSIDRISQSFVNFEIEMKWQN